MTRAGWVVVAALLATTAGVAHAAEDRREVQGRKLFVRGEYEKALDVYAQLFAEKADPIYLRNIGRCNQKLKRPDKAIDAFREYLRRAKVKPAEREEVEGFIHEMEQLQAEQTPVVPPPVAEPAPVPAPPPDPAAPSAGAPGTVLTSSPAQEPTEEATPWTHRWWVWTGVGAVVAGSVVAAVVLTRGGGRVPTCMMPADCPQ